MIRAGALAFAIALLTMFASASRAMAAGPASPELRAATSAATEAALERLGGEWPLAILDIKAEFPKEWEAFTDQFVAAPDSLDNPPELYRQGTLFLEVFYRARLYQSGQAPPAVIRQILRALADQARLAQATDISACALMKPSGVSWSRSSTAAQAQTTLAVAQAIHRAMRAGVSAEAVAAPAPLSDNDRAALKAAVAAAGATEQQQAVLFLPQLTDMDPGQFCAVRVLFYSAMPSLPDSLIAAYWNQWVRPQGFPIRDDPADPAKARYVTSLATWTITLRKQPFYAALEDQLPGEWHQLRAALNDQVKAGYDGATVWRFIYAYKDALLSRLKADAASAPTEDLKALFQAQLAYLKSYGADSKACRTMLLADRLAPDGAGTAAAQQAYEVAQVAAAAKARRAPVDRGEATDDDWAQWRRSWSALDATAKTKPCDSLVGWPATMLALPLDTAGRLSASLARDEVRAAASPDTLQAIYAAVAELLKDPQLAAVRDAFPQDWSALVASITEAVHAHASVEARTQIVRAFRRMIIVKHPDAVERSPLPEAKAAVTSELNMLAALRDEVNPSVCARYVVGADLSGSLSFPPATEAAILAVEQAYVAAALAGAKSPVVHDPVTSADYQAYLDLFEKEGGNPAYLTALVGDAAALSVDEICETAILSHRSLLHLPDAKFEDWWGVMNHARSKSWVAPKPSARL